ncbi:hypothetical protein GCM10027516_10850 [Niabella aquatica]
MLFLGVPPACYALRPAHSWGRAMQGFRAAHRPLLAAALSIPHAGVRIINPVCVLRIRTNTSSPRHPEQNVVEPKDLPIAGLPDITEVFRLRVAPLNTTKAGFVYVILSR